jgi:formamidopyrimidine-DNA glycosylase
MLELPEAMVVAAQIQQTCQGQLIKSVTAAQTPHKLTWYNGDPQTYPALLNSESLDEACGRGAMVEVKAGRARLLFSDGVNLRLVEPGEKPPDKHQLLIEFSGGNKLVASVQMYGGIVCFKESYDNKYYQAALDKPSPLTNEFSQRYFNAMLQMPEMQKLSLKAFLATDQRIPGIGNGVLQDILFNSALHPKKKVEVLTEKEKIGLFNSIKNTLRGMTDAGGRDTEKDLYGHSGGYITRVGKNTVGLACSLCGNIIKKESYMGGSIYYCPGCQSL